jgi:uncharacterized repeat protein (TIGR02543 family)
MKKKALRLKVSVVYILSLAITLLFSGTVLGTTYYVATTGSDGNTGTSTATPFLTLKYAIGKVVAGDTIYVRGGTYTTASTISISKSGTASVKYYLFVYPGDDRPILDFSGMTVSGSNRGMTLSGSYWYIKGIRIKGAGDNGMNISGGNNIIEFCDFYENRDGGCQLGGGAHDNRIINCDSYYNADYGPGTTTNGGNADGFSPKLDVGTNNYFYGCRAWLNSDDGWDGYLRPSDGVTTTLENCWTWKNGYLKDGVTTTTAMNGNGFKLGGSDTKDLRHNFIVKNCLSFNNKANGFDQNSNVGSITIYNGTSANNGGKNIYLNSNVTMPAGSVFTVKNTIAYGSTSTSIRSGTVLSNNQFSATAANFVSVDSTGVTAPRKADGSLPDITFMHLANSSSYINAGVDVGLPYNGTAPDLGCFETGNTSVQYTLTTSVAAGTGTVNPLGAIKLFSSNSIAVSATPGTGYVFDKWTDGSGNSISSSNPFTVSMASGDVTIKANFVSLPQYTLNLAVASGNGTIAPVSGTLYYSGTSVVLTATPASGYNFDKWTDANGTTLSSANPYTIVMGSADMTVKANFVSTPKFTLTTGVTSGSGTISPASGTQYDSGATASLTATPAANYVFSSWGGDASGTLATTTVVMNADKNVTASFALVKRILTLTIAPVSSGTVVPASGTSYDHGSGVKLTATPATGYVFDKWTYNSNIISTNDTVTITMDADKTIAANFKLNTDVDPIHATDNTFDVWYGSSKQVKLVFHLENNAKVAFEIYSLQGTRVYIISTVEYTAGNHTIDLANQALIPGVYLGKMTVNGKGTTRKIVVY